MDKINILCCTDDKYAPYYGVMLTSLFDNNKGESFDIYIMTAGLGDDTLKDYQSLTNQYHAGLHIVIVNEEVLKNCPIRIGDHITIATYYRLLAPMLLPNIEKILYLDGDIIINGNIRPLWETNIDNYAIAAVIDTVYNDKEQHIRLYLPQDAAYFNAGVLLINLCYWRQHDIIEQCLKCIEVNRDQLLYHDQDTLNIVLLNKVKYLPLKYNMQHGFVYTFLFNKMDEEYKKEILNNLYNPIIIHYSSHRKPWFKRSPLPYAPFFLYYRKHSLWKSLPLTGKISLKEHLRYYYARTVWALGIKKEINHYILKKQYKR